MKTIFKTILCSTILFNINAVNAQKIIPLYDTEIPNSKPAPNKEKSVMGADGVLRISSVSIPTLSIYKPEKSLDKGTSVIICPGGGYKILAASHEGADVARELNKWGITAFVLKYRIPNDTTMQDKSIGPLQDAQRAIQVVREHSAEWNLDPDKIGIMGFSAGGHLAASASTRFNEILITNPKNTSLRPDFSILIYPVISFMDGITHKGSRENQLGKKPDLKVLEKYSNELAAGPNTPPAFLVHAGDDASVPVKNSIVYYEALLKHKIYSNMFIYPKGGHGFGMKNKTSAVQWMNQLKDWISDNKFL